MNTYKLLTPGPLTVSDSVRASMNIDHCTWDDDYKSITQSIRQSMLDIAGVSAETYTTVLMQGSGTYGVEATISTLCKPETKGLIITNGKYGERLVEIAQYAKLDCDVYVNDYAKIPDADEVDTRLQNGSYDYVIMVHSETTSGILNPAEAIAQVVKRHNAMFILDAMSSFGGIPLDMRNIDAMITSSNKCIQGVPGFALTVVKRNLLIQSKGNATTLSLDLFAQYEDMEAGGKWRFTSPTHCVIAFHQALKEFIEEGGVAARYKRYSANQTHLVQGMEALGFKAYIKRELQGPIITTFTYPDGKIIDFNDFYTFIKSRGFVIYPGKLTHVDTFRLGNIGEIYLDDIDALLAVMKDYLEQL